MSEQRKQKSREHEATHSYILSLSRIDHNFSSPLAIVDRSFIQFFDAHTISRRPVFLDRETSFSFSFSFPFPAINTIKHREMIGRKEKERTCRPSSDPLRRRCLLFSPRQYASIFSQQYCIPFPPQSLSSDYSILTRGTNPADISRFHPDHSTVTKTPPHTTNPSSPRSLHYQTDLPV